MVEYRKGCRIVSNTLSKRSIIKKTVEVASATLTSRILGLVREALIARVLGAGLVSDAFLAAHKIPHFLRKIFAEGALTAAFVPTIVRVVHNESKEDASRLMTLSFLFFEGLLFALCTLIFVYAPTVIWMIVPGFIPEQIALAVPFLRILIGLILFISSSALLTGALNAVNHFLIPAFASVIINIFFIAGLLLCYYAGFTITTLCYFVVAGAFAQFVAHVLVYFHKEFSIKMPNKNAWKNFKTILWKFIPSLIGMSVFEVNLFLDTSMASFLVAGSLSRVHYASRFMAIPVSVIALALATILLPHFSRVSQYAPKRLSFYLFEATKLIYWVMLPVTLFTIYFSYDVFATLYVSKRFTTYDALLSQPILTAFAFGLVFFSLNKILINVFYALQDTHTPTVITIVATFVNFSLNYAVLQYDLGAAGLALATTIGGIVQTLLFYYLLTHRFDFYIPIPWRKNKQWYIKWLNPYIGLDARYQFKIYAGHLWGFVARASAQCFLALIPCYVLYRTGWYSVGLLGDRFAHLLHDTVLLWCWVFPIAGLYVFLVYMTRHVFKLKVYFVD